MNFRLKSCFSILYFVLEISPVSREGPTRVQAKTIREVLEDSEGGFVVIEAPSIRSASELDSALTSYTADKLLHRLESVSLPPRWKNMKTNRTVFFCVAK